MTEPGVDLAVLASPAFGFAKMAISIPGAQRICSWLSQTPRLVGAVLGLMLLASCASLQAPEPVRRPAVGPTWVVPVSVIEVPLRVSQAQAQAWTEAAVPETLRGEGSGQRTLSAWFLKHDWHFWWNYDLKRTPLAVSFDQNRVRVATSLTGDLTARWDTLPGEITSEVEADAGVEAALTLAEGWKLRAQTSVFLDVRRADVPIGIAWDGNFFGETISIAGPVRQALQPSLASLSRELDQRLSAWDLRSAAESAWRELQQPRLLAGAPLWLNLAPQSVAVGDLKAGTDTLEVPLQFQVLPTLSSGSRPTTSLRPLPDPSPVVPVPPAFSVNLPIDLRWGDVVLMTRDRWQSTTPWEMGNGAKIRLTSLEAFTDGGRVLLKVGALISPPWPGPEATAVLWVGARPVWSGADRTLHLVDSTWEVTTQDYLASAAAWLVGTSWMRPLEAALRWDMGPELDRLRSQAQAAFSEVPLTAPWRLSAQITGLEVVDWALTDSGVQVLSRVTGTASVTAKP